MPKTDWEKQKEYIDKRVNEVYTEAYNKGFSDGAEAQRKAIENLFTYTRQENASLKLNKIGQFELLFSRNKERFVATDKDDE